LRASLSGSQELRRHGHSGVFPAPRFPYALSER